MRKFVVFAFLGAAVLSAMTIAPASAYTGNAGAIEIASPVSSASATILAFNPQPDPPGLTDGDDGFDRG